MAETFELGFSIDTSALSRAAAEANKAAQAVNNLGNAERSHAGAANQSAQSTRGAAGAMDEASRRASQMHSEMQRVVGTLRLNHDELSRLAAALRGQGGLIGGLDAAVGSLGRFATAIGPMGLAVAAGVAGVAVLGKAFFDLQNTLGQAQDKFLQLQGRLSNSLGSTSAAKDAIEALRKSTQETGLGFGAASDAFARIARNNDAIGLTQDKMLQLVDTVQKLGRVSGASSGEMQAGMIQFGQAIASGKLQGDELRSIMENFPALAKAIADNFEASDGKIGVSIGTLRRLGSEGELTGSKIADAVLAATEKTNAEYAKLPQTIDQANQKVADSWEVLLVTLGDKLNSSGFVQAISNVTNDILTAANAAFAGPTADQRMMSLQQELAGARQYYSQGMQGQGSLLTGMAAGGYGYGTGVAIAPRSVADIEKEISDLRIKMVTENLDKVRQQYTEETKGLIATSTSAESIAQGYESPADKRKRIENDIATIQKGIKAARDAIARGGTDQVSSEDLQRTIDTLEKRRESALQSLQRAIESDKSVLANMLRDMADNQRALEMGGAGGGQSIVMKAIQQQRQDAAKGQAGDLQSYINAGLNDAIARGNQSLIDMARNTEKVRDQLQLVGKARSEVMAQEIEQEAAAEQARMAGILSSEALVDYMSRYRDALRESKQAADNLASANRVLGVTRQADLANRLLTGAQDPRSQARIRQDFDIEQAGRNMTPFAAAMFGVATRRITQAQEEQKFLQQGRGIEMDRLQFDEQNKLARLGSEEYRVQNALLQKRMEFLREGLNLEDERVKLIMRQTEENERAKIAAEKANIGARTIMKSIENGANQMEGVFKNAFTTLFTDGVDKASKIFGKGFGDIIKNIAADMIYELGYRALNQIALNFAEQFGSWFVSSFLGGGGAPAGGTPGKNYSGKKGGFAMGGVFAPTGYTPFAMGGAFTNSIVDRPTVFPFANGIGLMGEAGPEAIMPLKRGSDGRLGVSGGGGDVQVVINDMRSSAGAEPVETKSGRGPDGRRMISVMIRDEMRRQIRSGDIDRDMGVVYGAQRQLARK